MPARTRPSRVLLGAALLVAALLVHAGAGTWLALAGATWLGPAAAGTLVVAVALAHVVAFRRLRARRAADRARLRDGGAGQGGEPDP